VHFLKKPCFEFIKEIKNWRRGKKGKKLKSKLSRNPEDKIKIKFKNYSVELEP